MILIAIALPFAAAGAIAAAGRRPNLREGVTMAAALATFGIVLALTPQVIAGARPQTGYVEVMPGVSLGFTVEPLGMLFALIASGLWIVNSLYSIGYMRGNDEPRQTGFYVCFAIAIGSAVGLAFSGNLFTLFLFYEALTLSTYPLVTHRRTPEALRAGRLYLAYLLGGSIVLLLSALLWTWHLAGTLEFRAGGTLPEDAGPVAVGLLLLLYVFGAGKAAVMPMHRWLPAAMVAPTPVSALLHAVAVVKAGVFTILKVVLYVFGLDLLAASPGAGWLIYVAGITVIAASAIALRQDNLKRRLAYSTISQLSYVVLAAAILTPLSAIGAALHILAHAFGKITLFFAAGSIYTASHKTEVSQLDGIGRAMPWTMAAFAIGALSMIGVPPTAGFVGKWYMLRGAMDSGQVFATAVIVLSTLLNAGYFLPILYAAFFRPGSAAPAHGEAPWPIVAALTATAAGTVILFFASAPALALAKQLVGW